MAPFFLSFCKSIGKLVLAKHGAICQSGGASGARVGSSARTNRVLEGLHLAVSRAPRRPQGVRFTMKGACTGTLFPGLATYAAACDMVLRRVVYGCVQGEADSMRFQSLKRAGLAAYPHFQ